MTDGYAANYGSFVFAVAPVSRAPRLLSVRKRPGNVLDVDALVQQNRSAKVEARFWDVLAWTPVLTNRIPYGDWATNIFWTLTNVPMGCGGIVVPEEGTNYGKYIRLKSVAD